MQGKGRGERKTSEGGGSGEKTHKQIHLRDSSNHRQPGGHAPWMDSTNQVGRPPPEHSTWREEQTRAANR